MLITLRNIKTNRFVSSVPVKYFISLIILIRSFIFYLRKNQYRTFGDLCWLSRVPNAKIFNQIGIYFVEKCINKVLAEKNNYIIESFRKDNSLKKYKAKYSISGEGYQDIFRDIIVLKSPINNEKGVILLKYATTFEAFIYFFQAEKLLEKYYFVLEPCWSGYYITNILMWIFPNFKNNIFVQCFTKTDYDIIQKFMPYLIPIKLGPADWVNSDNFKPSYVKNKYYDLIMVANWSSVKRHDMLFKALAKIENKKINVLLIGFAWGGRNKYDILKEANIIKSKLIKVDIMENLSHNDIVTHLNNSKIYIFLSEKEGDNKAIVEAMFTDVPAIVYQDTIGGASSRVNDYTGIFSTYENLHKNVLFMINNYKKFKSREWAITHTGSLNSTRILNELIKQVAFKKGENFSIDIVEKINSPNLTYKNPQDYYKFINDYSYILYHKCK